MFRRAFRFIGRSVFLQDILTLIQVFYNCVFFGNCTQRVGQKFAPRCSLYSLSSLSTKLISSCYSTSVTAAKISFYPDDTRSRYFTRKAAFSVLQKTGDWRRRAAEPVDRGQPGQWLRTVEDDLRPLNFSLATASTQEHALERETKSVSRLARLACLLAQVFFLVQLSCIEYSAQVCTSTCINLMPGTCARLFCVSCTIKDSCYSLYCNFHCLFEQLN